jgi:uncharacterized protein (DUF1499 family)
MRYLAILTALFLGGCASTNTIPLSGTRFSLDSCPPLLNCVSSTATLGLYQVEPIQLSSPLDEASWDTIKTAATELPGARLNDSRFGYLDITCYSDLFHFPDYLEILVSKDGQSLDVRSQSQIGLYDFSVNRKRVEWLRQQLIERGVAVGSP